MAGRELGVSQHVEKQREGHSSSQIVTRGSGTSCPDSEPYYIIGRSVICDINLTPTRPRLVLPAVDSHSFPYNYQYKHDQLCRDPYAHLSFVNSRVTQCRPSSQIVTTICGMLGCTKSVRSFLSLFFSFAFTYLLS